MDGQENNRYVGVAPGANLIGVKVLDGGGSGSFDQVMAGMEWCIDHREEFNIRAATMSLGGVWLIELTQSEEEQLSTLANTMVHEGIALTIAAGNSGTYGSSALREMDVTSSLLVQLRRTATPLSIRAGVPPRRGSSSPMLQLSAQVWSR